MRRPRLRPTLAALTLILLAGGLTAFVPRAAATDPFPTAGVVTLSSDHFVVHYSRDDREPTCFITQEQAGDLLAMFEEAYRQFHNVMGYPVPVDDGDGKVDVSVDDFTNVSACVPYGAIPMGTPTPYDRWDAIIAPNGVQPGSDDIHLNATSGLTFHIVSHELFHLMQDAIAPGTDQWLQEGTAEWAAVRADLPTGGDEANPDRTLDCVGAECGDTEFDKNGYPGWMLFEYLAERYGDAKVRAVWDQAAVSPPGTPGTTILGAVLPVSLGSFFNDYTTARLTGNFTLPVLAGTLPVAYAVLDVPETSGGVPGGGVAVNHLAVRYIALSHGSSNGPCYQASLTLNVTIPAGVQSTPTYYANTTGATAQPLTVSGSTGTITVPWNTCTGSPDAYLSVPNASLGLDGRLFIVSGSVTVDKTKPATASAPPPGAHVIGSVISAPTSDPAPLLRVYAPEIVRVSAKTRLLRLAVFSSGDGKLQALLGSINLGTAALRTGNNDIRFVLPRQVFNSLRTKSVTNVLQLTSVSAGGSKGATFTRRVLVQTPNKPKPKPKRHS
jgi:hypothetical protein